MKNNKKNKGHLFKYIDQIKIDYDDIPLKEYPRPGFVRNSYVCLNGKWDLCISKNNVLPSEYSLKIMVPYAVESVLSGVNHLLEPDEYLYYHRIVKIPENFKKNKIILHFEGVDQYVEVYINNILIGFHMGGFTPFSFTLPDDIDNEFSLTLKVRDWTDDSYHSRGKQILVDSDFFYTSSSGVYKPIWMESVDEKFIDKIHFSTLFDEKKVKVKIFSETDGKVKLIIHNKKYELNTNKDEIIDLSDDFHPWSIENPYLYDVEAIYENDHIKTYFGLRKIEIKEINGFKRILLNNKPIFLSGLLDQGYYFLGNYTPRSYDDYSFDIKKTKEMGYNCLRKHIKTEMDMYYYLCDKEGILIIQDFPCGGGKYSFFWTVSPRLFPIMSTEKIINYKNMAREDEEGRKEFIQEGYEYFNMYHNNPCVVIYTLFNEGWGEFDPSKIYHEYKNIEHDKLFDTASGWYDADSDFYSIHTYTIPDMKRIDKRKRAFIISEMGGNSLKIENHSYFDGCFGHGVVKTTQKLEDNYRNLYLNKMKKQIKKSGLNMLIYTEIADCQKEYNGIFTFDRQVQKINTKLIYEINQEIYHELEEATK